MFDAVQKKLLESIADMSGIPSIGAYNFRVNGEGFARSSTETVTIEPKKDKQGIDIIVKPFSKADNVHIPVIVTESGVDDVVYNDFFIGEGAQVRIVAGCGIHNDGGCDSKHNGIHRFHIGKNAKVTYIEKHYGDGEGTGARILNPVTEVFMDEGAECEMETVQIKGVDSTARTSTATLGKNAKMVITERLMTHGKQYARSDMVINLNGEDASAQIISRSVAKDDSEQIFYPRAVGNCKCRAHVQCDTIIMDSAKVRSIPEIAANHEDAQIVHEAAIGKINNDQLTKLCTLGLSPEEAEEVIIEGFLD
ncbi:MAG: SufD family Fe-S cluster assembly protein [Clostridia bacterium]|nr:SufD family Fe-S cluster assembly protein [Clostridia bacterium]MBR6619489.1 SufD family Fe-S cluster assembly protein [Clostridia bacterium]